jgi:hypothetical protein
MIPYLMGFSDADDVAYNFGTLLEENITIIAAYYCYEDYSGYALVVFEQDGILWEVNGSHCSCYGLEGQWSPEKLLLEEFMQRPGYYTDFSDGEFKAAVQNWSTFHQ